MKITVEYEINDDGDCENCLGQFMFNNNSGICMPFKTSIQNHKQHTACKDYIRTQQSLLKCSNCDNIGDYPAWGCNARQNMTDSLNCKDYLKQQEE